MIFRSLSYSLSHGYIFVVICDFLRGTTVPQISQIGTDDLKIQNLWASEQSVGNALHCIHKPLLCAVEDDDGKEHCDAKHDEAVHQAGSIKSSNTQAAIFERLKYRSERIKVYYPSVLFRCKAQRVYDRCGIHKELNAELYEEFQVSVLCRPGGKEKSPRHGVQPDHKDIHWEENQ